MQGRSKQPDFFDACRRADGRVADWWKAGSWLSQDVKRCVWIFPGLVSWQHKCYGRDAIFPQSVHAWSRKRLTLLLGKNGVKENGAARITAMR